MPKHSHEVVSLFCGAGGLDLGFRREGFRIVLACDNLDAAVTTYNTNTIAKVARRSDLSRITRSSFFSLLDDVSPNSSPIGVIGGPPCQGFSRGNAYADPKDIRNRLPSIYANLLRDLNRRFTLHFFVFENVPGLLSQRHRKRFVHITARLEDAGFRVFQGELNANCFGVPQSRTRLFLVGFNSTLYPDPQFSFPPGNLRRRTVRDAIAGLPPPAFNFPELNQSDIPHHPNHWTSRPRSKKLLLSASTDGRSFRRLQWDRESPTVAYGNREIHVHPDGGRRLSIHEAMLLQGFPPSYRLSGTFSDQVTQVSNAVPPPVARAIARRVNHVLMKE